MNIGTSFFKGFAKKPVPPPKVLSLDIPNLGQTEVRIIRSSRRKSLALRIKGGEIEALAALHITEIQIKDFIKLKSDWINKKVIALKARPKFSRKEFISGEEFLYLGKHYQLQIFDGGQKGISIEGDNLKLFFGNQSTLREPRIRAGRMLEKWFKQKAEENLSERTAYYAEIMDLKFGDLKVRNYKSQWGSCSSRGDLKYNWRLIMAPLEILDYVVVHELSHIKHHNHSKAYWALVENHMPDYKLRRKWLRENGGSLGFMRG